MAEASITKSIATDAAKLPTIPHPEESHFKTPVVLRANFYRDNYRRLMVFCLLLVLVSGGLMGAIFYFRTHKPPQRYYVTTTDGKYRELTPLDNPNLSMSSILDWAVEASTSAYNFNFHNYDEALKSVRPYFTPTGYRNFLDALSEARVIEEVRAKSLEVFAVPTDPPVIVKEGETPDGYYAWQVQLPMLVTFQSASETKKQRIILTLLLQRLPTLESPKGIGIAAFQVAEKT